MSEPKGRRVGWTEESGERGTSERATRQADVSDRHEAERGALSETFVEVRPGLYRDSITLMRISRGLSEHDGVQDALTAMATGLNLDLLGQLGFTAPPDAGPNDLVVAIRAADEMALGTARDLLDSLLAETPAAAGLQDAEAPARTIGAAAARASGRKK
jgi:FdrA protein